MAKQKKNLRKIILAIAYVIIILLFVLLSVDFYLSKKYYVSSSDSFLDNPSKYSGQLSEFAGPVINSSESGFYMSVNRRPLKVYYSGIEKPKFGQLYAHVKLNGDGTATALEVHKLSYNYLKYIISFFAFIIFLFIFFNEWKIRKWRFEENA